MAQNTGEEAEQSSSASSTVSPDESAEPQPLVDALLDVVVQAHRILDAQEEALVRRVIRRGRRSAAELMAYPLTNADEPDTVFTPYRAD